jgi:hypothetical protein
MAATAAMLLLLLLAAAATAPVAALERLSGLGIPSHAETTETKLRT